MMPPHWSGVALLQTATRLRPNAFHFRRQVMILQRAGGGSAERQFKETCRVRFHTIWVRKSYILCFATLCELSDVELLLGDWGNSSVTSY